MIAINLESDDYHRGRVDLLEYFIGVADRTSGAAVWKALFVEAVNTVRINRAQHDELRRVAEQHKTNGSIN